MTDQQLMCGCMKQACLLDFRLHFFRRVDIRAPPISTTRHTLQTVPGRLMVPKSEDTKPEQDITTTAAAAAATPRSATAAAAAAAAAIAIATAAAAAAHTASADGAGAGQGGPAAASGSHNTAQWQQAGKDQQAERRHKRKAAEPQRAFSPCIVGFATQQARQLVTLQQGGAAVQHAAQRQGAQPVQQQPSPTHVPAQQLPEQQSVPPPPPQQPWQAALLHQQQLYQAQSLFHAQGPPPPHLPLQQHAAPPAGIDEPDIDDDFWQLVRLVR